MQRQLPPPQTQHGLIAAQLGELLHHTAKRGENIRRVGQLPAGVALHPSPPEPIRRKPRILVAVRRRLKDGVDGAERLPLILVVAVGSALAQAASALRVQELVALPDELVVHDVQNPRGEQPFLEDPAAGVDRPALVRLDRVREPRMADGHGAFCFPGFPVLGGVDVVCWRDRDGQVGPIVWRRGRGGRDG